MNSEVYELQDAMKSAKYAQTFESISNVIRSAKGDVFGVMSKVLELVCSAMHTEVGTLWYCDRDTDSLIRPKAALGGGDISGIALPIGEGIAGQVILYNKPAVIYNCQNDPRWAGEISSGSGFITRTMICVPLSMDGVAYGCIQLINKTDDTLFDDRDVELANMLAQVVSQEFNTCSFEGNLRQQTDAAKKLLVQLQNQNPDILLAALSEMPGVSQLGKLQKKSAVKRFMRMLDRL